ncbi:Clavaminate synthase-like protein [Rickenella mellea]|uniref:Clavaminate synthase-like protein n=1 Tax=Rickenella mellea TaxID=50990 RepID=A0A4R5XEE5_9AGAM|nr:Clavaminate synthase-like protein [Rickenella mellea]
MNHYKLDILRKLSVEYRELNGAHVETVRSPPSAVEFAQMVHVSRPVIIGGFKTDALALWSDEYLKTRMGDSKISVAVTPNGLADAITLGPDGTQYFVEPYETKMTIRELLEDLHTSRSDGRRDVLYLQSQNGNMFRNTSLTNDMTEDPTEFGPLRKDISREISWASEALGKPPDAVNVWIGDGRSVTSIHNDPYENIYTVIRGTKHFTLFPPTEGWCMKERSYPHARYTRLTSHSPLELTPTPCGTPLVRWSSIQDPTDQAQLPPEASPLQITLHPGDTLYLPAGWWHYVRQSGITIALNWWYDVEVRGMNWVWLSFLRCSGDDVPEGNDEDSSE